MQLVKLAEYLNIVILNGDTMLCTLGIHVATGMHHHTLLYLDFLLIIYILLYNITLNENNYLHITI